MATNAVVRARIDEHIKEEASVVLAGVLLAAANADKALPRPPVPTQPAPTNPFAYTDTDD